MCAGHGEARILWNSTNTRLTIAAVAATAAERLCGRRSAKTAPKAKTQGRFVIQNSGQNSTAGVSNN